MKKLLLLLVSVVLLLSLCACSEANEPYTVKEGWRTLEINPGACTISDETNIYEYTISGDSPSYSITITYPDGSTYYESYRESSSGTTSVTAGWSDDYSEYRYVKGSILCDVLKDELPHPTRFALNFWAILIIGLGAVDVVNPRIGWWLAIGWRFKDAEPSNLALNLNRVGGAICIIGGILAFFL